MHYKWADAEGALINAIGMRRGKKKAVSIRESPEKRGDP